MLSDAIDSIPEVETPPPEPAKGKATAETAAKPEPETAKPAAPPEPKRKGAWKLDETLLTEAALKTPDGIKAAGAHLLDGKRELHRKWLGIEDREGRFEKTKRETLQLQQNLRTQAGLLQNNLQALRVGDAKTVLSALGQLTGQDPVRWLEQLNVHVARNGKQEDAPEVIELRQELAEIRREREAERMQSQAAQEQQFVQRRLGEMVHRAQTNTEQWPEVARFARDNPEGVAQALHQIKTEYYSRHRTALDDDGAIGNLETQIRYFRSSSQTENGTPSQGVGGREPVASQPAKPESNGAQRSPGKSVTPSLASQTVTTREMTEEERLRDLAEDPEFVSMFGL